MRCFIAAWPDEPARLALAALSSAVRQRIQHRRAARVDDLYLTLAFIGDLADEDAFAVADEVAKLRFSPFDWRLDTLGFFEQAGVVWVGSDARNEASKPLLELSHGSRQILDRMKLDYDRRPLAPHVTLLRGVRRFDLEYIAPIPWRIESIALYRSEENRAGSRYSSVLP